jgi:hypothetical protein
MKFTLIDSAEQMLNCVHKLLTMVQSDRGFTSWIGQHRNVYFDDDAFDHKSMLYLILSRVNGRERERDTSWNSKMQMIAHYRGPKQNMSAHSQVHVKLAIGELWWTMGESILMYFHSLSHIQPIGNQMFRGSIELIDTFTRALWA